MKIDILNLTLVNFAPRHVEEFNLLFGNEMKINESNIRLAWKKEIPLLPLLTNLMPPKMAERFRKLDNVIIQQGVEARRFIVLDRLTERTDEQRVSLTEICERIHNQEYLTRLIFAVKFLELYEKFSIDVDEYVVMPNHLIKGRRVACKEQYDDFCEIFLPNGMALNEINIRYAAKEGLSIDWYINNVAPKTVDNLHTNILGIALDNFEEIKDGIRQEERRKLMQYGNLYSSKAIDIVEYNSVRDKTYETYFEQQKAHRSTALIIWLYTAELMHHYGDKS